MTLKELLNKHRSRILARWVGLVFDTYPAETARFLKSEPDRFANPVSYTIRCNLDLLLDDIINEASPEDARPHIEEIVKIRALQDFSPSQAVSFMWLMKEAALDELPLRSLTREMYTSLQTMELLVDRLAGMAFDIYSACKDTVSSLRIKELRAENSVLNRIIGAQIDRPGKE